MKSQAGSTPRGGIFFLAKEVLSPEKTGESIFSCSGFGTNAEHRTVEPPFWLARVLFAVPDLATHVAGPRAVTEQRKYLQTLVL